MEQLSFTQVPAEGFVAFLQELATDDWATIDISSFLGPNRTPARPLEEASVTVFSKLQLQWTLEVLAEIREGAGSAGDRDRDWDTVQKRLKIRIDSAAVDEDMQKQEAAERLRKVMLMGAGQAQTKLKYQQEVDFGRQQVQRAATGQTAADIALLGLGGIITDIQRTSDALAAAIGYGQNTQPPSERLRLALAACASMFSLVAGQLAWLAAHGQVGMEQTRAAKLRASLEALAARYPAVKAKPADEESTIPESDPEPAL